MWDKTEGVKCRQSTTYSNSGMRWIKRWTTHGCGVGSDLPEGEGGALDPETLKVCGAAAFREEQEEKSATVISYDVIPPPPPPPPLLPEMKGYC